MFFYGRIPKNKTLKREYKAFKEVFFLLIFPYLMAQYM